MVDEIAEDSGKDMSEPDRKAVSMGTAAFLGGIGTLVLGPVGGIIMSFMGGLIGAGAEPIEESESSDSNQSED